MMQDLKTSLDDLAQAEYADAPVSTVDIGKARADGRRRMRTARLAPVGGGVAVVAACALVVTSLGGTSPANSSPQNTAAGDKFTGSDPLTAIVRFGYLPDGFQAAGTSASKVYGDVVTVRTKPEVPWGSGQSASLEPVGLRLNQSTAELPLQKYMTKKEVTVAGAKQAFLITNPGDDPSIPSDLSLQWQTESGSWFSLGGDYQIHGAELEAMLIKVAGQVTADDSAVALPIHIEGMPKGVVLDTASLNNPIVVGKGGVTVGLEYAAPNGGSFRITATPVGWTVPEVDPISGNVLPGGSADPELGGVQKAVDHSVCKNSEGLHICVLDAPAKNGDDPLASVGGAQGLLSRITSLGTDPAHWTTHVVN